MSRPKILVTGATGKTGGPTVQELTSQGWPVRAVAHREDLRSEKLRQYGAEIVVADLYDYEQTFKAMQGVQRASFLPPSRAAIHELWSIQVSLQIQFCRCCPRQ